MKKSERIAQLEKRVEALENAMIKPKSGENQLRIQPEIGGWYWFEKNSIGHIQDALVFVNDLSLSSNGNYGFNHLGEWLNGEGNSSYAVYNNLKIAKKATDEQVEEALVKEAKRRGYKSGMTAIFGSGRSQRTISSDRITWEAWNDTMALSMGCDVIFRQDTGKWAEIIEQPVDKFAELKEAHRNGAAIQSSYNGQEWVDLDEPSWLDDHEYRIKPEEKPKIGDVCLFSKPADENNSSCWEISRLSYFDSPDAQIPYKSSSNLWYREARVLTKQEAINLLFGHNGTNGLEGQQD